MNKILSRILILGTLFIPVFYVSLVAGTAQQSYPLVCRGSASASISFKPERTLVMRFIKGGAPADSGLSPGQCSWVDRGMSAGEPDLLAQQVPEGADERPEYKWVSELRDPDTYWTFDVYSDGKGKLIVTGSHLKSARPGATAQQPNRIGQEPVRPIRPAGEVNLPQAPGPVRPRQTIEPRLGADVELSSLRSIRSSCTANEFATLTICATNGDCFVSYQSCFPYQCDSAAKTCATSCRDGGGCAPGMICADGKCVYPRTFCKDHYTSANSAGAIQSCGEYACDSWSGLCFTVCSSESDCGEGSSCNSDGKCFRR